MTVKSARVCVLVARSMKVPVLREERSMMGSSGKS